MIVDKHHLVLGRVKTCQTVVFPQIHQDHNLREVNQVTQVNLSDFPFQSQDGLLILSALADTASDWVPVIAAIILIIRHFPQRCH